MCISFRNWLLFSFFFRIPSRSPFSFTNIVVYISLIVFNINCQATLQFLSLWVKMVMSFTRLSSWFWNKERRESPNLTGSPLISSFEQVNGSKNLDDSKFASVGRNKMSSHSRKIDHWIRNTNDRRIDREFDLVVVPSEDECILEYESDDSELAIGWFEPHALDFQCEDDIEDSFAVLVRCYRHDPIVPPSNFKFPFRGRAYEDSSEQLEQWLSSLQREPTN